MQIFRLVGPHVDRVIAFDELPKRLLEGIRHRDCSELPRYWKEKGCNSKEVSVKKIRPGSDPKNPQYDIANVTRHFHYMLEYQMVNADKEKWAEISDFVRRAVDTKFRLKDKLEDMALPMAGDFREELKLEPEAVLEQVIPIPLELQEKVVATETKLEAPVIVTATESGTVTGVVGKAKHTCEMKGRLGRLEAEGKCLRCDQLRIEKKQVVTA